jgi:hypothetical protein
VTVAVDLVDVLAVVLEHDPAARVCAICGAALNGRRGDARYCGAGCRREAGRLRALLAGVTVNGYGSVAEYLNGRQKRAKRACGTS